MPAPSSSPSVLLDAVAEAGLPPESLGAAESIGLLQALEALVRLAVAPAAAPG